MGLKLPPGWGGGVSLLPSTKLEGRACALAQVRLSVYSSPSPLKALRESGINGERVPSLLPSIELEAEVGAEAPTSASVLLSPSPLMALRERGTKGVRVPFSSLP